MTTIFLRYLDVCLVLATAPFVLAAGMPVLGYAIGTVAWLLTRVGAAWAQGRAAGSRDMRVRAGLQVGTMMARVWIVAAAVIAARYAGGKDDGIMAAVVVLAAFTVYFVLNIVTRGGQLPGSPRPSPRIPDTPRGRPSTS
jgi:hypothetical protein